MCKGDKVNRNDDDGLDFDCITEMGFESRDYYEKVRRHFLKGDQRLTWKQWIKVLLEGNSGDEMTKDEEAFIDRDRLRYCLVEEVVGTPQLEDGKVKKA
jgi:hypothetical protein